MTIAVHALAWLALAHRRGREHLTSEQVAASVNTNAVILRRSLGDLKKAGLVDVKHGAGAGWSLARAPHEITLAEVYAAVEPEPLFALHHREPNLECPVGYGIRPVLSEIYRDLETALRQRLETTTLAGVLDETLKGQPA